MIWRTFDPEAITAATEQSKEDLQGIPPTVWLSDENNIALRNLDGDLALFEHRQPGVYCGHYFFLNRGKSAIETAEAMLEEAFSDTSPIRVILGFTPLDKKGALWLSRHLGFEEMGVEEFLGRPHQVFVMTKEDYLDV